MYLHGVPPCASTMQTSEGVRFYTETPETHWSKDVQTFIQQEIDRPSKMWVQEVVRSDRESEFVKLRTSDFVLLPDLNGNRRQSRVFRPRPQHFQTEVTGNWQRYDAGNWSRYDGFNGHRGNWQRWHFSHDRRSQSWPRVQERLSAVAQKEEEETTQQPPPPSQRRFNWLAIMADPSIRSIRDLRREHVDMLESMYAQCMHAIQKEYNVEVGDVMVFANYPPSVYRLHFHFCAPFFQPTAYDAFRMHSLSNIINNLKMHPRYYEASTFQIPVHSGSDLCKAIVAGPNPNVLTVATAAS